VTVVMMRQMSLDNFDEKSEKKNDQDEVDSTERTVVKRNKKPINLSFVIRCVTSPSFVQQFAAVVAAAAIAHPSSCSHCSPTALHLRLQPALQVQTLLTLLLQSSNCRLFLSHLLTYKNNKLSKHSTPAAGTKQPTTLSKKLGAIRSFVLRYVEDFA